MSSVVLWLPQLDNVILDAIQNGLFSCIDDLIGMGMHTLKDLLKNVDACSYKDNAIAATFYHRIRRRCAFLLHPDKNKNPLAKHYFQRVNEEVFCETNISLNINFVVSELGRARVTLLSIAKEKEALADLQSIETRLDDVIKSQAKQHDAYLAKRAALVEILKKFNDEDDFATITPRTPSPMKRMKRSREELLHFEKKSEVTGKRHCTQDGVLSLLTEWDKKNSLVSSKSTCSSYKGAAKRFFDGWTSSQICAFDLSTLDKDLPRWRVRGITSFSEFVQGYAKK